MTTYKQITEMQYRCCPGFFGENCDMGNTIWSPIFDRIKLNLQFIGILIVQIRMLQLHDVGADGTALADR